MSKAALRDDNWLIVLAVLLALVIFNFPLTVYFPLLDPDEGLHASIAQEMVERGDWLTPHFQGEPFFDKPILYFWCQALSLKIFGMNEVALRLPGLMFGLLGVITTGLVGWRLFDRLTGWISAIFYGTMILPVALAQAAAHDVALVPSVNLSILLLWESDRSSSKSTRWAFVAATGFLLGLSILTKGLVGLAIVGVAYGSFILMTRRLSIEIIFRGLAVCAIAVLVASAWFIAVEFKHSGFLHYYFIQRHVLGFATSTQIHGEAHWWYYLPIILGGGLPWIGYLPVTFSHMREQNKSRDCPGDCVSTNQTVTFDSFDAIKLLLCWLICSTILLSISHSKLITYIWPVFPSAAILAAVGWARLLDGTLAENARRSLVRSFFFSSITGPVILPLVVYAVQMVYSVKLPWTVWTAAVLAGLAALIPIRFMKRGQWQSMLIASTLSTAVQFVVALTLVLPLVAENYTARGLAEHFNQLGRLPVRLLVAEERIGSLIFYLEPSLRSELREKQIDRLLKNKPTELPPGTIIALPERFSDRAEQYKELLDLPYKTVGRYRLYEKRD
jgi:4-amino-4-deoxy-L-arabinose transferase-like glycosyltransferase